MNIYLVYLYLHETTPKLHPGRLTWNIQITHLERKMIFPTSMIMFHGNLLGCTLFCRVSYAIHEHLGPRGFQESASPVWESLWIGKNVPTVSRVGEKLKKFSLQGGLRHDYIYKWSEMTLIKYGEIT